MKKLFSLILVLCMLAGAAAFAEESYTPAPVRTDTQIDEFAYNWKCFCKGVSGMYLPVREDVGSVLTMTLTPIGAMLLLVDPVTNQAVNMLDVYFENGAFVHQEESTSITLSMQEDGVLQMQVTQSGATYALYFRKI